MARYFSLPDGTYVEIPEGMDTELARRIALTRFAGTRGIPKEAATKGSDIGSALTSGIANTLGIVPGIYGLLGGSYENAPLAGTVKGMREYAAKTETPETTYKKYLIDQAIANASKQGGVSGEAIETLKQLAINPGITGLKLVELIPDILASVGTGGLGVAAGKAAVKTFSKEAGEEAVKRGAQRGAATGAIGMSAAQEGTSTGQEVYEETYRLLRARGVTEESARAQAESAARGATVKQGLTVAALGRLLPGAEKALLGVGKGGVRRVAAGESAEEGLTGISGQLTQNIAAGEIDPSIALSRGVGRAGTEGAALGALAGAGVGAFTRRPTAPQEVPPETKPADPVVDAAVQGLVNSGDVKPDEVVEADAAARLADIRKARAEAEKKAAAEAEKVEGEDELRAAEEKKEPAAAAAPAEVVTPIENLQPPADTTDGTQTAQTQQAEAQGQEAPAAAAAAPAALEVVEGEVPAQTTQTAGAPSGTVAEGSGTSVPVVGGTSGSTPAAGTGAPATGGVGQTSVDAGGPAGGTAGEPAALKGKKPATVRGTSVVGQKAELTEEEKAKIAQTRAATEAKAADEKAKRDAEAIAREAEQKAEEKRLAAEADENADVATAYEKLNLKKLEAKAAEVKAAPLAKAGEKISTRANLRTFDVAIPIDQARLEEKLAEVRKIPEKSLTPAQRAIRWYGAYAEANGGALKDIPRYLAFNRADPEALATTGSPKKYLQPAITWLNSNLGGKVGSDIELAASKIQTRLKEVESQRIESEAGADKRTGGRKVQEETVEKKAGTFEERLKRIAASEKKDAVRAVIAERILQLGAKPDITEGRIENGSPAAFDPKRNAIIFDPKNIKPETDLDALFMHEATHAVVDHAIDNPDKLNNSQKNALARLKNLHEAAKKSLGEEFNIGTLKEFAAETFSNPDFQAALKKQKSPITPFNLFDALARTIARLLGVTAEGNAFVDAVNTVDKLISAPTKSRQGKEVSYAPADKKYVTIGDKRVEVETGTPEPIKKPKREKTPEQKAKQDAKEAAKTELAKNLVNVPLSKYDKVVRWAQNLRRSVLLLEEELRKKNLLTPDLALNTEMTLEGAESAARQKERVQPLIDKYQTTIQSLAKKMGKAPEEAVDQLERYFIALTEPERRLTKFFEKATLSDAGERRRGLLFKAIVSNDVELKKLKKEAEPADKDIVALIPDTMTNKAAKDLYAKIEEIVMNDPEGALQDIDSSAFQTAGFRDDEGNSIPMTSDMSATIRKETEDYLKQNPEIGDLYQQAQTIQRDLEAVTREMNREAGYGSPQLERLIAARQWKNYVPLRGKPDEANQDPLQYEDFENEERVSSAMVQTEASTRGRKSAAENVIFRAFAEANRAAARPSRSKVTQVVKNLVKKGYVAGEINPGKMKGEPSTFAQRFIENKKLDRADNLVYHYREDGLVDVIMISNNDMARAIRNSYPNSNKTVDFTNKFTSAMGQMLTRYNPAFWAKNFLADVLTNSFVLAAEQGKGGRYIWQVVSDLVDNKLTAKGMNFIRLYEAGKTDELNKLAEKDSWYKDAQEYVRVGGKISQLSGLSTAKQQEATYNSLGPGRIVRTKQQLDRLITPITDGLELAARVSAFRTYRALNTYKNDPRGAAAASKNLANFENIGQQGRLLGALFMFFRPSATGAVRAIDALKKGKYGPRTAIMAFGMGVLIHNLAQALSDDDEEGRNRISTDDPNRWVRNWRFYIPGFKDPIQIPWGFGIGMLASFGAQVSMKAHGDSSWGQLFSNSLSAVKEGFAPLPFSQISPTEHPFQFLVDTAAPSVARPLLQYAMNLDSLNREIFNQSFNRYSPMYVTKENMPESLNQFSKFTYDTYVGLTGSPPPFEQVLSPTGISFFMNNYLSAVYKLVGTGDDLLRATFFGGQKDLDPVKASMVLGSFKGTPANYDLRKYKEFEQEMNKISSVVKTFEKRGDEESLDKYYDKFPEREDALKFFNKQRNGELKKLQQEAGAISREYANQPAERKKLLEENRKEQNEVMLYIMTETRDILAAR